MIYLLRHGEIDSGGKKFIGHLDMPLNNNGMAQVNRWKTKFSKIEFNRIYSSTLTRCRQTADILGFKKEIYFFDGLREINLGDWNGLFHEEVKEKYPQEWVERGSNFLYRPPGGESFDDFRKRVLPIFDEIASLDLENTLIISHAGVIRVIISYLLKIPDERLFSIGIDYAGLCIIDNKRNPYQLLALNLTV